MTTRKAAKDLRPGDMVIGDLRALVVKKVRPPVRDPWTGEQIVDITWINDVTQPVEKDTVYDVEELL